MKTIADFKRRMTVGTLVDTKLYHPDKNGNMVLDWIPGIRSVSIVRSNSFAFATKISETETVNSWNNWPKSNEFKVIDENTISITECDGNNKPWVMITYELINNKG